MKFITTRLEVEFGEIDPKGGNIKHHLFMKNDKLVHGTIFLNGFYSLLNHVASS
jgi:hypothetical protein